MQLKTETHSPVFMSSPVGGALRGLPLENPAAINPSLAVPGLLLRRRHARIATVTRSCKSSLWAASEAETPDSRDGCSDNFGVYNLGLNCGMLALTCTPLGIPPSATTRIAGTTLCVDQTTPTVCYTSCMTKQISIITHPYS